MQAVKWLQLKKKTKKNVHRRVMMRSLLKHEVRREAKAEVADMTLDAAGMKNELQHSEVNDGLLPWNWTNTNSYIWSYWEHEI